MPTVAPMLHLRRGLYAALGLGLLGAVIPVAALAVGFLLRWATAKTGAQFSWDYDFADLKDSLPGPALGCALLCACAGWATYAPHGSFRFATSLGIIFGISAVCWLILTSIVITPPRLKGIHHPAVHPSELISLVIPPVLAAGLLTWARICNAVDPAPKDDAQE